MTPSDGGLVADLLPPPGSLDAFILRTDKNDRGDGDHPPDCQAMSESMSLGSSSDE
jgi:hypothetical protein